MKKKKMKRKDKEDKKNKRNKKNIKNNHRKKAGKISREYIFIILLFCIVLGARLAMVLSDEGFDYNAYNTLRQAEHIKETGVPLFKDPLSYSGRTTTFPPLFYYVLALFSLVLPLTLVAKLIPSIGFASLVLVIYVIARYTTKNRIAAFIAAFFAGFVPIIYTTLDQASVYSLSLPLIFLLSYTFLRIEEKGFAMWSIILIVLLLLTHTSVFILLISFLVYFLILKLGRHKINIKEVEVTLFLLFLALWFNLLLYKKAFFLHGVTFIWQNIPAPLLSSYFMELSFIGVIYAVGVIPLLLGVYAVYHTLFKTRNKAASLYISFALISFMMLWLKLIPFTTGLLFLSMNLIILSASSTKLVLVNLSKTKKPGLSKIAIILIGILFILTTITPLISTLTLTTTKPPAQDLHALEWIKENTKETDVILGRAEEGFLITYAAERKNVADNNFMFIKNINQRYHDVNSLFTLRLKSEAIRLTSKYDIDYVLLSTKSMGEYGINTLFYAEEDCFEVVYDKDALIYEILRCEVE